MEISGVHRPAMFLRRELYEVNFTLQDASHTPLQFLQQFAAAAII